MIGSLTKRVTFGLGMALFAWAYSGLIEPVAYADQKGKPDACFGLEKQLGSAEQALTSGDVDQAERLLLPTFLRSAALTLGTRAGGLGDQGGRR